MSTSLPPSVPAVRWLADEMLGRLARYLRFLGQDTEYAQGTSDAQIGRTARSERRILITRDRELARKTPGAILLRSSLLPDQLRELKSAVPDLPLRVSFVRCTECNGAIVPARPAPSEPWPEPLPSRLRSTAEPVYRCPECGHWYWEGSHTRRIREDVDRWLRAATP